MIKSNFILLIFSGINSSFTQTEEIKITDKHHVSTSFSYYYFFDSTPILKFPYLNEQSWVPSSFALSYSHTVNFKYGWSASADYYNYVNQESVYTYKQGDVLDRHFFLLQGNYHRFIKINQKGSIALTAGLGFRIGSQGTYITLDPAFFVLGRGLLDVGIPVGVESTYYFWKHFHAKARLSHSFFPIVYDKKRPYYPWDKGAPRNMSMLTFSLGFNF